MSTTQQSHVQNTFNNPKAERLHNYLVDKVRDAGEVYVKGKFIADDVNLSTKEIGGLIPRLQEETEEIVIEKWSYTGATTWRVAEN